MSGLRITELRVRRGGSEILSGINLDLDKGRIVGVIGPNGAGKSTLLSTIANPLPREGDILFDGSPIMPYMVSYLPQNHQTRSRLSVVQVLLLGMHESLGWRVSSVQLDLVNVILDEFDLQAFAERSMDTLSGGQQQRVMLAQRLISTPQLVLLDEPTSALDLRYQLAAFDILQAYVRRTNALVLIAVHDLNLAAQHCTDLLLLDCGRLVESGPPTSVLNKACIGDTYCVDVEVLSTSNERHVIVPLRHRMAS